MGITARLLTTRSFILMNNAARFTGSSAASDARYSSSYSGFCQRVTLRPYHLLALLAISPERKDCIQTPGSGLVGPVLYI